MGSTSCNNLIEMQVAAWKYLPLFQKGEKSVLELKDIETGTFVNLLKGMVKECCRKDIPVSVDDLFDSPRQLEESTKDSSHFLVPALESNFMSCRTHDATFIPLFTSPGAFYLRNVAFTKSMIVNTILTAWPWFAVLVGSSGCAGIIIWILETRWNSEMFPRTFIKGFWEGVWWAFVSMTTVGYGDITPKSVLGRIFGIIWILTGLVMVSVFTATLATSFTAQQAGGPESKGAKVGVLNGSEEMLFGVQIGAQMIGYNEPDDMISDMSDEAQTIHGGMMENYFALHVLGRAEKRKYLESGALMGKERVYGLWAQNVANMDRDCFTRYLRRRRWDITHILMANLKPLEEKKNIEGPVSAVVQLVAGSKELLVASILLGSVIGLVTFFCGVEYVYNKCREWRENKQYEKEMGDTLPVVVEDVEKAGEKGKTKK